MIKLFGGKEGEGRTIFIEVSGRDKRSGIKFVATKFLSREEYIYASRFPKTRGCILANVPFSRRPSEKFGTTRSYTS